MSNIIYCGTRSLRPEGAIPISEDPPLFNFATTMQVGSFPAFSKFRKSLFRPREPSHLPSAQILDVFAGHKCAFVLLTNGDLYTFGEGSYGELGLGKAHYRNLKVTKLPSCWKGLRKISAGSMHTLALMDSGEFYSWGSGSYGALGTGDHANVLIPEAVKVGNQQQQQGQQEPHHPELLYRSMPISLQKQAEAEALEPESHYADIAAGRYHSLFVSKSAVFSSGQNSCGVLGQANPEAQHKRVISFSWSSSRPALLPRLKKEILGVASGSFHALAWTRSGALYSWGKMQSGSLGYSMTAFDDFVVEAPTLVEAMKDVKVLKACCGDRHSIALSTAGKVYSWGFREGAPHKCFDGARRD